ncbi:MAG: hypothetical protein HZA84_01945 [Thaumarchaeota archaeon]|nr:hypothetical protein [Nitrososphaerota archaeon]
MSLYIVAGNGKFLLNNGLGLCPEIVHAENESKIWNMWRADQISENPDKNDIFNHIGGSIGCMLKIDDNNLVKYGQQTAISVTNGLIESFHALYLSSKVI